jgi:hypothetical protein
MKRFTVGLIVGLALGAVTPAAAAALVGSTGYLFGWSVTKDGEDICYMPFVWTATREIECD